MSTAKLMLGDEIAAMRDDLAKLNRTMGALHVLIQCAKAEASSSGAKDAAHTLEMAEKIAYKAFVAREDVKFGGDL